MSRNRVQLFRCVGGPLDGHVVTEQYAGPDYTRFISSRGEVRHVEWCALPGGRRVPRRSAKIQVPKNVLLFCPEASVAGK